MFIRSADTSRSYGACDFITAIDYKHLAPMELRTRRAHSLPRGGHYILNGEPEMFQQLFQWSRGAELATGDDATIDTHISTPTQARSCFNGNPCSHRRWQH